MFYRYRKLTKPVSVEDLKLGMHVADEASKDHFPMKPASAFAFRPPEEPEARERLGRECGLSISETENAIRGLDEKGLLGPEAPPFKALRGLKNVFSNDLAMAIWTRLIALAELADEHEPEMKRWSSGDEPSDAVLQVAATFPFRSGTFSFNPKPFFQELERRSALPF